MIRRSVMWAACVALMNGWSWAETAVVRVKVIPADTEIFNGQAIRAKVEVTNIGTADLEIPRPDRAGFSQLLTPDQPGLGYSGGVGIISVSGESPTIAFKPGETVSTSISLSGKVKSKAPVTFRMGFRLTPQATPVWSAPVTVRFKADEPFPVKVETDLPDGHLDISDPQKPGHATAHLRVTNTSRTSQDIGISGECCLHELQSIVSDNSDMVIESGVTSCMHNPCPPQETTLRSGETWTQYFRLTYAAEEPQPKPIRFRIGIKNVGHVTAWGNAVTVQVTGGTPLWTHHVRYIQSLMKEAEQTEHPDGITKMYYESGVLMEERPYKNGKLNGVHKRYTQDGRLCEETPYVDNQMEGAYRYYYPDGKLRTETIFHNGEMETSISYNPDGKVSNHMRYRRLINGRWTNTMCVEADDPMTNPATAMNPRCTAPGPYVPPALSTAAVQAMAQSRVQQVNEGLASMTGEWCGRTIEPPGNEDDQIRITFKKIGPNVRAHAVRTWPAVPGGPVGQPGHVEALDLFPDSAASPLLMIGLREVGNTSKGRQWQLDPRLHHLTVNQTPAHTYALFPSCAGYWETNPSSASSSSQ